MKVKSVNSGTGTKILNSGKKDYIRDNSGNPVYILLPKKSTEASAVVLILNVTSPYAKGSNYPGLTFSIQMDKGPGEIGPVVIGSITSDQQNPDSSSRVPVTLIGTLPLADFEYSVYAYWESIRGSEGVIDESCVVTLTAMLADGWF